MSNLERFKRIVIRVARPFAKADTWSEYAGRAYWRLGALALGGVMLILFLTGSIGGLMSQTPPTLLPYADALFEVFKPANFLKTSPLWLGLILIFCAVGMIPKFRGVRDAIGGVLANSFYLATDRLIAFGEWCIRNRGWSMLIIGLLAFLIGWAATGFFQTRSRNELLAQGLNRWLNEAERFVLEEPLFSQKEGRLKDLEELWQDEYKDILQRRGGYTHTAAYLHEAIRLLDRPKGSSDRYNIHLYKRVAGVKDGAGNVTDGFEKIAAKCDNPTPRRSATRENEVRACGVMNILLAKLYSRFADANDVLKYMRNGRPADDNSQDEQRYFFLKQSELYYRKVKPAEYVDVPWGKRQLFSVNNGIGTVNNGMLAYLKKHDWEVVDAPCTKVNDCVSNALHAFEEAEKNLLVGQSQEEVRATERYSRLGGKLSNNRVDLLARLAMDYDQVSKRLSEETRKKAHMESKEALQRHLEESILQITKHNAVEGDTLRDSAVTIAQAYGACLKLREAGARPSERLMTREQLAKAAGFYLRIVNSFEPRNYDDWGPAYFCQIVGDDLLVNAFGCAVTDEALGGMPDLPLEELINRIGGECKLQNAYETLRAKIKCGQPTSAKP